MIYLVLRMHQLQKYHLHVNGLNASRINGMSHSVRLRSSILPMSGISGGGSNNFLGHLGHQRKVNCINEKKKKVCQFAHYLEIKIYILSRAKLLITV